MTPDTTDDATVSPIKKQPEVAPQVETPAPSGAPMGRRGRLANLAATIGSWEDDLSHPTIPQDPPPPTPSPKPQTGSCLVPDLTSYGGVTGGIRPAGGLEQTSPVRALRAAGKRPS